MGGLIKFILNGNDAVDVTAILADLATIKAGIVTIDAVVDTISASAVPTATTGTFTYTDAGGEQTIFEINASTRKYIKGLSFDMTNITQNGTFKIYSEVDGATSRLGNGFAFVPASDDDWYYFDILFSINRDFKVTYTEAADEGADRAIPYSYILEG